MLISYYCDILTTAKQDINDGHKSIDYLIGLYDTYSKNIIKSLEVLVKESYPEVMEDYN